MEKTIITSGKTIDLAIEAALNQLGIILMTSSLIVNIAISLLQRRVSR